MGRSLTKQLFGLEADKNLLGNLSSLETHILQYNEFGETANTLRGNVVVGVLHNLLDDSKRRGDPNFIITHTLHSSSCCITVELQ